MPDPLRTLEMKEKRSAALKAMELISDAVRETSTHESNDDSLADDTNQSRPDLASLCDASLCDALTEAENDNKQLRLDNMQLQRAKNNAKDAHDKAFQAFTQMVTEKNDIIKILDETQGQLDEKTREQRNLQADFVNSELQRRKLKDGYKIFARDIFRLAKNVASLQPNTVNDAIQSASDNAVAAIRNTLQLPAHNLSAVQTTTTALQEQVKDILLKVDDLQLQQQQQVNVAIFAEQKLNTLGEEMSTMKEEMSTMKEFIQELGTQIITAISEISSSHTQSPVPANNGDPFQANDEEEVRHEITSEDEEEVRQEITSEDEEEVRQEITSDAVQTTADLTTQTKRGPGRPRKTTQHVDAQQTVVQRKRGPGRPRMNTQHVDAPPTVVQRKRGRPPGSTTNKKRFSGSKKHKLLKFPLDKANFLTDEQKEAVKKSIYQITHPTRFDLQDLEQCVQTLSRCPALLEFLERMNGETDFAEWKNCTHPEKVKLCHPGTSYAAAEDLLQTSEWIAPQTLEQLTFFLSKLQDYPTQEIHHHISDLQNSGWRKKYYQIKQMANANSSGSDSESDDFIQGWDMTDPLD